MLKAPASVALLVLFRAAVVCQAGCQASRNCRCAEVEDNSRNADKYQIRCSFSANGSSREMFVLTLPCHDTQVQGDPADFPSSWWEAKVLEKAGGKWRVEVAEVRALASRAS